MFFQVLGDGPMGRPRCDNCWHAITVEYAVEFEDVWTRHVFPCNYPLAETLFPVVSVHVRMLHFPCSPPSPLPNSPDLRFLKPSLPQVRRSVFRGRPLRMFQMHKTRWGVPSFSDQSSNREGGSGFRERVLRGWRTLVSVLEYLKGSKRRRSR